MTAADFALMSDPVRNRLFSRLWAPPGPPKRERRPLERTALENQDQQKNTIAAIERHAQRLATSVST